jgi:hypothetical protein
MKKLMNLLLLLVLSLSGFSQSLTLGNLEYLLSDANKEKFLEEKSFKIQPQQLGQLKPSITYYSRNISSNTASETVVSGMGFFNKNHVFMPHLAYMTKDTAYINNLIKQIYQANFRLVEKKLKIKRYFYRFKGNGLNIWVTKRQDNQLSQVYLMKT